MKARAVALVLAGVIAVYLLLLGQLALALIATWDPMAIGLGLAVLAFPVIGAWAVWRELRFGFALQHLSQEFGKEPTTGFEAARTAVRTNESDWRAWYALGKAYDRDGDRKRARSAMRQAIALQRAAAVAPPRGTPANP